MRDAETIIRECLCEAMRRDKSKRGHRIAETALEITVLEGMNRLEAVRPSVLLEALQIATAKLHRRSKNNQLVDALRSTALQAAQDGA